MNSIKLKEISIIFDFIKKNFILYVSALILSIIIIFLIKLYENNVPKHENTKIYSLIDSVKIDFGNSYFNLNKEVNYFNETILKYAFGSDGTITKKLADYSKYDCSKLKFSNVRDLAVEIKLKSKKKSYIKEFEQCSIIIKKLIIEAKKNFFLQTSSSINKYRDILILSESKTEKLFEKLSTSIDLQYETLGKLADPDGSELSSMVSLIRKMENIDREILELNYLKNWISSENLLILNDSTLKIKILNQVNDYLFVFLFCILLSTLIGFLRIK